MLTETNLSKRKKDQKTKKTKKKKSLVLWRQGSFALLQCFTNLLFLRGLFYKYKKVLFNRYSFFIQWNVRHRKLFLFKISDLKNMEEKIGIIRKFSSLIRDSTEVTLNGIKFFCDFKYSEISILMNLSAESFFSFSFEKSIFTFFNLKFKQANIDFYDIARKCLYNWISWM